MRRLERAQRAARPASAGAEIPAAREGHVARRRRSEIRRRFGAAEIRLQAAAEEIVAAVVELGLRSEAAPEEYPAPLTVGGLGVVDFQVVVSTDH